MEKLKIILLEKLPAIKKADPKAKKGFRWMTAGKYKCFCGKEFICYNNSIEAKTTLSCGCQRGRKVRDPLLKFGENKTRLYSIYYGIKSRCYNKKHIAFHRYGGRGIIMCEEWKNEFSVFRDWALANGYEEHLTVDRKDNSGNYEPSNCRFASAKIQAINTEYCGDKNKLHTRGVRATNFNTYTAIISINRKNIYLGSFKTIEEASTEYEKARKQRDEMYHQEKTKGLQLNRKVRKYRNPPNP